MRKEGKEGEGGLKEHVRRERKREIEERLSEKREKDR